MSWIRILTLIVLVMNIGIAAWWSVRPARPPASTPEREEPGVPGLVLLSELEQEGSESMPPAVRPPGVEASCFEVGPFMTQVDLRRAMSALATSALRIQFRESRAIVRRGYRVFIRSPGSREAALDIARSLSARGLDDYYVVTAGSEQDTISLGVYRDPQRAEARLREITALGFEPEIEPRNDEQAQFWIDLEVEKDADWRHPLGGYAGVSAAAIQCSAEQLGESP